MRFASLLGTLTGAARFSAVLLLFLIATLSCGENGPIDPDPNADQPPTVGISSPANGTTAYEGAALTLEAAASDPEDGDLAEQVDWRSDIDGDLSTGASISPALSVGSHTITASVTDSKGQTAAASIGLGILKDHPPAVAITAPEAPIRVLEGTELTFTADAEDEADGDLTGSIAWTSDVDGELGAGARVERVLSTGTHRVIASVEDSRGQTAADTQRITVAPPGEFVLGGEEFIFNVDLTGREPGPPYWRISWYLEFDASDPVIGSDVLVVHAYGEQGGVDRVQSMDVTEYVREGGTVVGPAVTADPIYDPLLDGRFSMGLEMPSGTGRLATMVVCGIEEDTRAEACDTIGAGAGGAPAVSITAPADGTVVAESTLLAFTATAADAEDGDLGSGLTWTSDRDGHLGTGDSIATELSVGPHIVTASVTDSDGNTGADAVELIVDARPTVTILAPTSGSAFAPEEAITFQAEADDAEEGDLSSGIVWASSLDGALGTGASVTSMLSDGSHLVTAAVTDGAGGSAADTIVVVVDGGTGRLRAVHWINPNGGSWNIGSNWDVGTPPLATDSAVISLDGTYAVTVNDPDTVAAVTVGGGTGTQRLVVAPCDDTNRRVCIGSFQVDTSAHVRPSGILHLADGTLASDASVVVHGGLRLGGDNALLAGGMNVRVAPGASLLIDGPQAVDGVTLRLEGSGILTAALGLEGGSTFVNEVGADLEVHGVIEGSSGEFINRGDVTASGGWIPAPFRNTGSMTVIADTLVLTGEGASTGDFLAEAGAVLRFGSHTLAAGSSAGGDAIDVFTGRLVVEDGAGLTPARLVLSAGVLSSAIEASVRSLELRSGILEGPGTVTTDSLLWAGGAIVGGATVNVVEAATWESGFLGDGTLNLGAATTWETAGVIEVHGTGTIHHPAGAALAIEGGGQITGTGGTFVNDGDMTVSGSPASIGIPFQHAGSLEVTGTSLTLAGGGAASAGSISLDAAGTIVFEAGYTIDAEARVVGPGTVELEDGGVVVEGEYHAGSTIIRHSAALQLMRSASIRRTDVVGGLLLGPGPLDTDTLIWHLGTIGDIELNVSAFMEWAGDHLLKRMGATTLNLSGNSSWESGSPTLAGDVAIHNLPGATFEISAVNAALRETSGTGSEFVNAGTILIDGGFAEIQVPFQTTGTVRADSGSILFSRGGLASDAVFAADSGAIIRFGADPFVNTVYTIGADAQVSGEGAVVATGQQLELYVEGEYDIGLTIVELADLHVPSTLTSRVLALDGGSLFGPGTVAVEDFVSLGGTLGAGATINVSDTTFLVSNNHLENATLNLGSTTVWASGDILATGTAVMRNPEGATLAVQLPVRFRQAAGSGGLLESAGAIEFALSSASSYGRLTLSDGAVLDLSGAAIMAPVSDYAPESGETFDVLTSPGATINGAFSGVTAGWTITTTTAELVAVTKD